MKKLLFIAVSVFCLLPLAQARGIIGKWYCPRAFFDSLGVSVYPKLNGYYKFEGDGTFTVKISGEMQSSPSSEYFTTGAMKNPKWMKDNAHFQTLLIKVKGLYAVYGNTITTTVDSADVYVYIDTGLEYPEDTGIWVSRDELFWRNLEITTYDIFESHAEVHSRTLKREKMGVWRWNAVPFSVTHDCLQVGERFKFTKKRVKSKRIKMDMARTFIMERKKSARRKKWVPELMAEAVARDSLGIDLYCLGLVYMYGLGVECDSAKAVELLEKAAKRGYKHAYHGLGMMYKQGLCGVSQDFGKAYDYFYEGADRNNGNCLYELGNLLYKGLGCRQNYRYAIRAFLPAAEFPHKDARALYFLGVCCRNGYGVKRDSALAFKCLDCSSQLGYREAKEEMKRKQGEAYMHAVYANDARYSFVPDSLPDVRPSAADGILTDGSYSGFIVTYDWSGKYILDEQPLSMTVGRAGGELSGTLTVGKDEVPYRGTLSGGRLVFSDGNVTLPERYVRGGKMDYELDSMALDATGGKIGGRLNLYSAKLKEPGRPMYMELRRVGYNGI